MEIGNARSALLLLAVGLISMSTLLRLATPLFRGLLKALPALGASTKDAIALTLSLVISLTP